MNDKAMTPEQQAQRDRMEVKISKIDNGFLVKAWPQMLAFKTLAELVEFLKTYYK